MTLPSVPSAGTAAADRSARVDDAWTPGPLRPQLAPGSLHVWRAELETLTDDVLGSLSVSESARAARFPHAHRGLLWARARAVLRELLARYCEIEPAALELTVDQHGKPDLAPSAQGRSVCFNLSHSGPLAVYAFTPAAPVGIDVQVAPTRPTNLAALARRAFGAEQGGRLARLDPAHRAREFLRAWARREASLKCRGDDIGAAAAGVWVTDLHVGRGAAAAVAVQSKPHALRCWSWP
jgi:4'-phosphopantetheinyl transferase